MLSPISIQVKHLLFLLFFPLMHSLQTELSALIFGDKYIGHREMQKIPVRVIVDKKPAQTVTRLRCVSMDMPKL
jgi:hypothetical protein